MSALEVDVRGAVGGGALALDVALRAAREPVVVVGPNGAGKTSLLMMILGAARPAEGRITLDATPLFDSSVAARVDVPVERRDIGYLPQRYGLFPHLDALHNAAYGVRAPTRAERLARAARALDELDVGALAARRTATLSAGEAQRVALARALARRPRALLLDEPLAALDVAARREVRRFLSERLRAWGLPTIVVTHDLADAEALGGEIVVLERGRVTQRGALDEVARAPLTPFARELFGA